MLTHKRKMMYSAQNNSHLKNEDRSIDRSIKKEGHHLQPVLVDRIDVSNLGSTYIALSPLMSLSRRSSNVELTR